MGIGEARGARATVTSQTLRWPVGVRARTRPARRPHEHLALGSGLAWAWARVGSDHISDENRRRPLPCGFYLAI